MKYEDFRNAAALLSHTFREDDDSANALINALSDDERRKALTAYLIITNTHTGNAGIRAVMHASITEMMRELGDLPPSFALLAAATHEDVKVFSREADKIVDSLSAEDVRAAVGLYPKILGMLLQELDVDLQLYTDGLEQLALAMAHSAA
ncbi:MAG: hypothetical protein KDB26_08560 [Microthrixaceae bacterium]|nr:hypothetical protein [Microthrixaceae bacterium]